MYRRLTSTLVAMLLVAVGTFSVVVANSAPAHAQNCTWETVESNSGRSGNGVYTLTVDLDTDYFIYNHQIVYCHDYDAFAYVCSGPSTVGGTVYAYDDTYTNDEGVGHYNGGGASGNCAGYADSIQIHINGTGGHYAVGTFYASDGSATAYASTPTFYPPN